MKFPYQRYTVTPSPSVPDGIFYPPEAPLRVIGSIGDASFLALVDSGADETLLPRSIGEAIGVRIDDITQSQVAGIGGQLVDVWCGQAALELTAGRQSNRRSAVVAFDDMEP